MNTPTLIVNCKTYETGSGNDLLALAEHAQDVAEETGVEIVLAVQNADLHRVNETVDIPVYAQHADPQGHGSNTGKDIVETLRHNGADGVLINHSEDQVSLDTIEETVARAHDTGLETVVCVDVPEMVEKVAAFDPDAVAYEPPELIGGSTSVTSAKPDLLKQAVKRSPKPLLTGAGIKTRKDVAAADEYGSVGVLVASGVVKADDPAAAMRDLVSGFQ